MAEPEATSVWRLRPALIVFVTAALVLVGVLAIGGDLPTWLGLPVADAQLTVSRAVPALPPLSTSDVAMIRARNAFSRGQLAEALQALARVAPDGPLHAEADVLRVRIQQSLIASTFSRPEARRP